MSLMNVNAPTVSLACSTSSGSVAVEKNTSTAIFYNAGDAIIFVNSSQGSGTATSSNYPLPPGTVQTLSKKPIHDTINAIAASGTPTLYVTCGSGE